MAIELYETMFALDSTKMSAEPDALKNALHASLEKHGGEIVVARPWDENGKLAYAIRKQNVTHKKAFFYIVYYKMESTHQSELDADLRINESLIRYLTSNVDPKWAETMLDIARNETGVRFAHKGMQDDSAPTGEGIISNDPMVMGALGMDFDSMNGGGGGGRGGERPPPRGRGRRDDKPE